MESATKTAIERALQEPVDGASLAAFRMIFGTLLAVAAARFLATGMVQEHYLTPRVFFPMGELTWLRPLPGWGMYGVWGVLVLLGGMIAVGLVTRAAAALFCLLFTYAHAIDKTHYLNHYYLVSLLTALLAILPAGNLWSLDALRSGQVQATAPAWTLYLLRFQVGCVYFFGGVAKLKGDWLFRAQPLKIWLPAAQDTPLIGPLLRLPATPWLMSWTGALYDLTIPFLLLWSRSRPFAYLALVIFHTVTGALFNIGMFPLFMVGASLLFLPPSWPRFRLPPQTTLLDKPRGGGPRWVLVVYVVVQVLLPLRHWIYPGNVLWTEDGFRFAWNVMLIEKTGSAEFTVVDRITGRREYVRNRDYLTPLQEKAMAAQPDLLLAFAHHLAREHRTRGRDVAVYVDAFVSLNGRPPARLVPPDLDLTSIREGWGPRSWILPLPCVGVTSS
ncbi:MAG: HTTM domain-containing protein [Myxococcales bacterium]|nr:HTTM domain-containing protein [Polyangiaceae bacterium]MDW8249207.1 HTTM domain-containing protein [Myxococcales bacterium]